MNRPLILGVLAFVCLLPSTLLTAGEINAASIVLISNNDVSATSVDKATVEKLFLAKTKSLGDKKVKVTTLKSGVVHESFLKHFVGKTVSQFNTYWKKLVFSGKSTMPKAFVTEAEMIEYVAKTPGAVGYIKADTDTGGKVKTIKIQ